MAEHLSLWTHALAALVMAAVAWRAAQPAAVGLPRTPLVVALVLAALWALAVAGLGGDDPATWLIGGLRDLALLALMVLIHRGGSSRLIGLLPVYGVVALVASAGTLLQLLAIALSNSEAASVIATAATLLRMLVAVAALVLLNNLSVQRAEARLGTACVALAGLWGGDLVLATSTYLTGAWTPSMLAVRGALAILSAVAMGIALQRDDRRPVAVSRTVAYQSLSLVAVAGYLALLAVGTSTISALGGESTRIYQTAFVFGTTAAVLTLVSSTWLRAWLRVKIAKHLFTHRFDYRAEWLRFTGTLGTPEAAAPLAERIVKAIADLTESTSGLLLVPDADALGIGAHWRWDGASGGATSDFATYLTASERIVALDDVRGGTASAAEAAAVPQWMVDDASVWAVVPMLHLGRLIGAVVLARPEVNRDLDWEDFDLLKVAGRQVASYLAEARAQDALADVQRFDEFNRRFAFIVHDIKNLVSGLSLLARNAERHADNPEFRADMVATLQDSAAKLNMLLSRLSAGPPRRADPPTAVPLLDFVRRVAKRSWGGHPVMVVGDRDAVALTDPARLEQILSHLLANAADASASGEPVTIAIEDVGGAPAIAVVDRGCGMSPAFVRDQLFRPFVSSKPGGFGIGAFEARQLADSMGARIAVDSREGAGTTFRILLPAVHPLPLEAAA